MIYLLHIDTSGERGTVAISKDGVIISIIANADTRNHAATINLHIATVLQEAGITMQQLNAIVICGGPGSYTGLRIGLATAKGLCYVLDKPLMMHSRLRLLSLADYYEHLTEYEHYMTLLQAREKEYYIALYSNKSEIIIEPRHITEEELIGVKNTINGKMLVVADINEPINNLFSAPDVYLTPEKGIDVDTWAKYAIEEYYCNHFVNLEYAEPFYLKQVFTHNSKKTSNL